MKAILKITTFFLLAGPILYISCKKVESCKDCRERNKQPVANAGNDTVLIYPSDSVIIDGSRSSDPDDGISGYLWTKISGPTPFKIINTNSVQTLVKNLEGGIYQFELKVTDAGGLFSKDTIQVTLIDTTNNRPPHALATSEANIYLPTNTANLSGRLSSDPDNDITAYLWTKISGPSSFNIASPNESETPVTNLVEGSYEFELKVTDAGGLFSKDTAEITVLPECFVGTRPIVHATLTPIGNLSDARFPAVAAAGNKVVFAGGIDTFICGPDNNLYNGSVDIYDVVTHAWTRAQLSKDRLGKTVVNGNKIFFAGGEGGNPPTYAWNNVDIYDVVADTWTVAYLSEPRHSMVTATIGSKVFFFGGYYWSGMGYVRSNKVDIYDLSTNKWTDVTMASTKSARTALTIENKIYFGGGNDSDPIDIYDNTTNTWSISNLPADKKLASGRRLGNFIYWVTGSHVEIRNLANDSTTFACISQGGIGYLINNEIVFLGKSQFDIFSTTSGTWSIGLLNQSINWGPAVISANNTLFLGGGSRDPGNGCVTFINNVYILNW